MSYVLQFNLRDRVIVVDRFGNHLTRGVIVGRHATWQGPRYAVQPDGELSLTKRVTELRENELRPVGVPRLVTGVV